MKSREQNDNNTQKGMSRRWQRRRHQTKKNSYTHTLTLYHFFATDEERSIKTAKSFCKLAFSLDSIILDCLLSLFVPSLAECGNIYAHIRFLSLFIDFLTSDSMCGVRCKNVFTSYCACLFLLSFRSFTTTFFSVSYA